MKLQAVIVLYKQLLAGSETISTLLELADQARELNLEIELLLYDNSPEAQDWNHPIKEKIPVIYVHDTSNGGLVPAYNRALALAKAKGIEWIFLLDQDTPLSIRYFEALSSALHQHQSDQRIAAFVPHIQVRGKYIAPSWFQGGVHRHLKPNWHGVAEKAITTINSAAVIRVSFVDSIGEYNNQYPVNFLDYWFFREVYRRGKMVWVLDCDLEHGLSVANRDTFPSVARYQDIIRREGIFYRSNHSLVWSAVFWSRLMLRGAKHYIVFKDKGYSRAAFSYFWQEFVLRSR